VEENLSILKEIFLLLKRYEFQLNYKTCHFFLKIKIEYLSCMIERPK